MKVFKDNFCSMLDNLGITFAFKDITFQKSFNPTIMMSLAAVILKSIEIV